MFFKVVNANGTIEPTNEDIKVEFLKQVNILLLPQAEQERLWDKELTEINVLRSEVATVPNSIVLVTYSQK